MRHIHRTWTDPPVLLCTIADRLLRAHTPTPTQMQKQKQMTVRRWSCIKSKPTRMPT